MAYTTNRFCWLGLVTPESDKSAAFYTEAVGWKTMEVPMGDTSATMFVAGGVPFAHYMAPPMPMPSHWQNYVRVDDVDATNKLAKANGGDVMMPSTDIPVGRFSVVTSPSGAALSLFHEADEATSEHHPGGEGSVHWVELHSQDVEGDKKWLEETFGYTASKMPMPDGGTYYILMDGEEGRGGLMKAMNPDQPSGWVTWFHVNDIDAAHGRVKQHGGTAFHDPMDMEGVGRMFMAQDTTGAVFGLIQPAEK